VWVCHHVCHGADWLLIGSLAAFMGWTDEILMRFTEIFQASLLLAAITLTSVLQTFTAGEPEGSQLSHKSGFLNLWSQSYEAS